ncbi:MAG: hypothetical protein C5B55_03415 [Blastocatellia bacterium]|nr:MAG: hypothetical protein C5B55_03415 [Blastocatellia bacterium]
MPRLLLIAFGNFFGLFVAEISLRLADYPFPKFYQLDVSRGYALRPGVEGWYRKEGISYVRINSDDLRDVEHSKTKPPNTLRIAVVGDSYAEALQVGQQNSFWALLEERLTSCVGEDLKVEVINFGVSGYGTAQELLTIRERVWSYSPDLVILAFTTGNDISDNVRELKRAADIPYFISETSARFGQLFSQFHWLSLA